MTDTLNHDLAEFLRRANATLKDEYDRIQRKVRQDPGTAGDQGEENWADFLRAWLPTSYKIVTKGRIIGVDGRMSRQIDLLVLKPSYPEALISTKTYLAAGVAAAFECKITLLPQHIHEAVNTCKQIKGLFQSRTGTPQRELHSPIVYGLLAHSHNWKAEKSDPSENISSHLNDTAPSVDFPRYLLDVVCVADVGTWSNRITPWYIPRQKEGDGESVHATSSLWKVVTSFMALTIKQNEASATFSPLGMLLWSVFHKMAREDATMRDLAEYYRHIGAANGHGLMLHWPEERVYTDALLKKLRSENLITGASEIAAEWSEVFY